MPGLPELTHREVVSLLRSFGCSIKNPDSPQLIGRTTDGKPYVIHLHPNQRAHPELVADILKRIGISRKQFWEWYNKGR